MNKYFELGVWKRARHQGSLLFCFVDTAIYVYTCIFCLMDCTYSWPNFNLNLCAGKESIIFSPISTDVKIASLLTRSALQSEASGRNKSRMWCFRNPSCMFFLHTAQPGCPPLPPPKSSGGGGWGTSPVTAKTTHDTCKLTKKVLLLGREKNLDQMPRITRRWELRAACSVLGDSAWILDDLDLKFASKFHCGDGETRSLKSHKSIFRWKEMGIRVSVLCSQSEVPLSGLWGWQSGSVVLGSTYLQKKIPWNGLTTVD